MRSHNGFQTIFGDIGRENKNRETNLFDLRDLCDIEKRITYTHFIFRVHELAKTGTNGKEI